MKKILLAFVLASFLFAPISNVHAGKPEYIDKKYDFTKVETIYLVRLHLFEDEQIADFEKNYSEKYSWPLVVS